MTDYPESFMRNDPRRHLPNDVESVARRQDEANARGEPYYPTPWECQELGKWWNVPEDEQAELIKAETADHAWQEIIEQRLTDPGLYHGRPDETPTAWDGGISDTANWGNIVTNTRIGTLWLRLNPDALGRGTGTSKTISGIMRKLGWTLRRMRVPGMMTMPHVWCNPDWSMDRENNGDGFTEGASNYSEPRNHDESDDIPF